MYRISSNLKPKKMSNERKKEISDAIKSYRSSDDVIAYLFALLGNERLPADDKRIHTAIFKLKREYPEFFRDLIFSRGDIYPFSKELETILFGFQQSDVLGTINPTLKFYTFPKKSREIVLKHVSKKFSEEEKKTLSEMSEKLQKLLYRPGSK